MRILTATLGLVALVALAVGLTGALAKSGGTLTVTTLENSADDAGCLVGEVEIPIADFGEFVQDANGWRGSSDVVLSIPLSQTKAPQAIDCRIEVVAHDLLVAGSAEVIPSGHLTIAGCDVDQPVSLAAPRAMTCGVDAKTTSVQVIVSLIGLDRQPTGALSGTMVISGINGT